MKLPRISELAVRLRVRWTAFVESDGYRRPSTLREFQSDPKEVDELGPVPAAYVTLLAAAVLILLLLIWASISKVDQIVVGYGRVLAPSTNLVVSPLETAVVRSIDVHVGDLVRAGGALAHLDPTFAAADVGETERRKATLDAQVARLNAELAGILYEPADPKTEDERLQVAMAKSRRGQYDAQLHEQEQKIAQTEAQIMTHMRQIDVLRKRLELLRQEESIRKELEASGHGSKLARIQAEGSRLEGDRALAQLTSEVVEMRHQLEAAKAARDVYVNDWHRQVAEDLMNGQRDLTAANEQLKKAARRNEMVILTTPADAIVLEIAPRSVGSVVQQAETLFTLVPIDRPMEIEAAVDAADIGRLETGLSARIKLDAFPYQRYGTLGGKVSTVSAESFTPESNKGGRPFYKARIKLDSIKLRNVGPDFNLIPGMTANAEIKVGTRRLITYLLYPIIRGFDESFHEP